MSANILVIKLGALGDFIQAAAPFGAIRRHHGDDAITLLTTPPFADFAASAPWFDAVWTDVRPGAFKLGAWLSLRRRLCGGKFERVYDLQTSDRSSGYFRLFGPGRKPEWSGIAKGCSHPHANPRRDAMHTAERQAEQLAQAGIGDPPAADFSWLKADVSRFDIGGVYALLVPGGARHRPEKRWPMADFASLARWYLDRGVTPVLLGNAAETALGGDITRACGGARDLTGQTTIADLFVLAQGAQAAVGNDTGPMHAIAASGCVTVVLFSAASDPALCAPRGDRVRILARPNLGDLAVTEVTKALEFT